MSLFQGKFEERRVAARSSQTTGTGLAGGPMRQLPLALFDEIECGLIVCDDEGQVVFANQAAQRELVAGRVLAQSGAMLRRAPGASGELDAALRLAGQRCRRSLVRLQQGDDRLMVSVLPLSLPGANSQHVLVMLGRRLPCSELGLEMLATSHGLTLAERRVLAALVRQATPREIAAAHAVSLTTVRTQISSIRAKVGTRSIDGLLLRAAEMPPVAGALRMAGGMTTAPQPMPSQRVAA
jgi:DNA-binding CsgD family transcriptional regulator